MRRPLLDIYVLFAACAGVVSCAKKPVHTTPKPTIGTSLDIETNEDVNIPIFWRDFVQDDNAAASDISVASVMLSAGSGKVSDNGNGSIEFDPRGAYDALQVGDQAMASILLTLVDVKGNTGDPFTINVTIDGEDDPPSSVALSLATTEKGVGSVAVPMGIDPDDATRTLTANFAASGVPGKFALDNGTITFDPEAKYEALGQDQVVALQVFYTLLDSAELPSPQGTLHVKITGVNDAPLAHDDALDVADNRPTTLAVLKNDSDPDAGNTLAITATSGLDPAVGTLAVSGPTLLFTPTTPSVGMTYAFSYTVSDGRASASAMVSVHVVAAGVISSQTASQPVYVTGQAAPNVAWTTSGFSACTVSLGASTLSSALSGSVSNVLPPGVVPSLSCQDGVGSVSHDFPMVSVPAYFVDALTTGAHDGLSWETAFATLADAMSAAAGSDAHVWVKEGTYSASGTAPALTMSAHVALFGGFSAALKGTAGSEDIATRPTHSVLDGGGSSSHAVVGASYDTLDGFTVKNGHNTDAASAAGAGIFLDGVTQVAIRHCLFTGNVVAPSTASGAAESAGGGLYARAISSLTLTDCVFDGNSVAGHDGAVIGSVLSTPAFGGGARISGTGGSTLTVDGGSVFHANQAVAGNQVWAASSALAQGGGLYVTGVDSVTLDTVTFTGNGVHAGNGADTIGGNGGGADGGGLFTSAALTIALHNVTFDANTVGAGTGGDGGGGTGGTGGDAKGGGARFATTGSITLTGGAFTGNVLSAGGAGTGALLGSAGSAAGSAYAADVAPTASGVSVSGNLPGASQTVP